MFTKSNRSRSVSYIQNCKIFKTLINWNPITDSPTGRKISRNWKCDTKIRSVEKFLSGKKLLWSWNPQTVSYSTQCSSLCEYVPLILFFLSLKTALISFFFNLENKVVGIMKPGHCFTIEPMINQGNFLYQS